MTGPAFHVWGLPGIPEVSPGDDLVGLLTEASAERSLTDGDIVIVTSKIVSKAEGRMQPGPDREAAIDTETVRTVSEWTTPRGRTRIVETRHGFVMAAAGVDASNVEPGMVVLLPVDPNASARRIRDGLRERLGVRVGVILTDTAGRVWRNGVVDMAIGAAGVLAVDDLRGQSDPYGNDLGMTVVAVADELAAASELVRTKLSGIPVAVVRGLAHLVLDEDEPDDGASVLVRPSTEDRFRLGTPEAMRAAVLARRTVHSYTGDAVDPAVVRRAVAAALTGPHPPGPAPQVRFVIVESVEARADLVTTLREAWTDQVAADDVTTLAGAASVVVPCLVGGGLDALLALGAAVENLLVTLAADGLGAAWLFPTQALTAVASRTLDPPGDWTPMGIVAIGHPADPSPDHPDLLLDEFTTTR